VTQVNAPSRHSVRCTTCDFVMLTRTPEGLMLHGRQRIELAGPIGSEPVLLCCNICGGLVPIEADLLRIY
jgi:hypothetical protein